MGWAAEQRFALRTKFGAVANHITRHLTTVPELDAEAQSQTAPPVGDTHYKIERNAKRQLVQTGEPPLASNGKPRRGAAPARDPG